MQASFNACSTVPGPERGGVYQPCSYWPSGLLGCWALSAGACYALACDDLLVWLFCLPVYLLLTHLYLSSYLLAVSNWRLFSSGCLSTASLNVCCPLTFFSFPYPSVLLQQLPGCHPSFLSGRLLSICQPACCQSGCLASQPRDVWIGPG